MGEDTTELRASLADGVSKEEVQAIATAAADAKVKFDELNVSISQNQETLA
jgi:pectin methylesterase-like acyl-CoA thioesterase